MRIIPKNTKIKMTFYKGVTFSDVIVGFIGLVLVAIALSSNLSFRFLIAGGILIAFIPLFISINGDRLYKIVGYFFKHLVSRKKFRKAEKNEVLKNDMQGIIPYDRICGNGVIALKDLRFAGVMEIHPVDFRMLSEFDQNELIDGAFSRVLNNVAAGCEANIVKLERPLILDNFIADEMDRIGKIAESKEKGELTDKEYETRVDVIQDRITTIDEMNSSSPILYARYYLVLQSGSEKDLSAQLQHAALALQSSGVEARILSNKELAAFIRYSIDSEFDERNLNGVKKYSDYFVPSEIYFGLTATQQNGKTLTHFAINNYPLRVGNGWGEGLFDIPNTKVVMKMKPVEKFKAIRRIDNAILEVQTQNRKNRASDAIEKDTHLESLQRLLSDLQNENDVLFDTTVVLTAYDEKGKNFVKKQVRRRLREMGFGFNELIGRQMDAYLTSQICSTDKLNISRGIQTSSIAAVFPFISNAIVDDKGLLIGENKLPVFVDFTKRDEAHLSSNMIVLGKPGSGKSYACKSLIAHIASCNTRVFVLDPESEYGKLCQSFGGKVLDVSSGKFGKLNPFHIIRTEDDTNSDGTGNDYFAHLQFLEEFYRVVLPGINADSLELLNKLTQELYEKSGITAFTDLSRITAKQYPTFDELGSLIDERIEKEKDEYNRGCLKVLLNYISKFRKGGRYSNLWNGATSFNPQENFVVFDFQKLLANKNNIVANAQMLLIVKWLENEVVKNKDYNVKHGTARKLVVAVDESHLFIDEKYPIALDFMASLAKRIRKYEGMLITITQSVKDVAGTPEIARKSQALIDVCQYSLIFSLSPNDMSDLCDLYAHAGQINEAEQNYIMHNKRGTAFFISSSQNTKRMDAFMVFERCLNQQTPTITDEVEDEDGKKKRVTNKPETVAARERQRKIKEAFKKWIFDEPIRREHLVNKYNEIFNTTVVPQFDGSYLTFPGMNPEITLKPYQKDAVDRMLQGNNTLLHHSVGAGKTFEIAAACMKQKEIGTSKKPIIVVPNHLVVQWANEFRTLYPNANVLMATKKDFEKTSRKRFIARVATGDWDAVVIAMSSFEKIPISQARQEERLNTEIFEIELAIREAKEEKGERIRIKDLQRTLKNKQAQLEKLMDRNKKDDLLQFEDLGVDFIFVDEAHKYKNKFIFTKMNNVSGISKAMSQRSTDMDMKCEYMGEMRGGDKGVVFATGTPISNSLVEMYTLQTYLQRNALREVDLQFFDSWAALYTETITALELAPSGQGYRTRTRVAKFNNLPELLKMYRSVADVKTPDMLNLPVPKVNKQVIDIDPTEDILRLNDEIVDRSKKIADGAVKPWEDNMLCVTHDGKMIALDPRCSDKSIPDDSRTKVNVCINNIFKVWEETKDIKGTQLVFCDMSTPKVAYADYNPEKDFDVYNDIKRKLVAYGIPEEEIAYIHEAKTDQQKQDLFDRVRNGDIRVFLGSTEKCGAGTNIQDHMVALHHVDTPYRPSDLEQREGRIVRQGNLNAEVQIFVYVTKRTFDAYSYQLLETKQKFISQINHGDISVRFAEDIDEATLSFAQIKAITSDNPKIKRKMEIEIRLGQLGELEKEYRNNRYYLQSTILWYKKTLYLVSLLTNFW